MRLQALLLVVISVYALGFVSHAYWVHMSSVDVDASLFRPGAVIGAATPSLTAAAATAPPTARPTARPTAQPTPKPTAKPTVPPPTAPQRNETARPREPYRSDLVVPGLAVVVLCYQRADYLRRTLSSLFNDVVGIGDYPVYVSQDGNHQATAMAAREFRVELLQRPRRAQYKGQSSTGYVAQHYGWILQKLFEERGHTHVVMVEEDMVMSPDFLYFFEQTAHLLDQDESLWCVSTWNDNGFEKYVDDPRALRRTSYFPGLGWMMPKRIWTEIGSRWPLDHWDHWMRVSTQHKGRDCVVPEISRNYNIGVKGANMDNAGYNKFLKNIAHNKQIVHLGDVSYILRDNYDALMRRHLAKARSISPGAVLGIKPGNETLVVMYKREEYARMAASLGIWNVPRAHHQNLGLLKVQGNLLLLADRRLCPLLSDTERLFRNPSLQVVGGNQGQSCNDGCRRAGGLICDATQFDFINTCDELKAAFPCESGCGFQVGEDIPNYVSDSRDRNAKMCLVTDEIPRCQASHPSTARLCPCVRR